MIKSLKNDKISREKFLILTFVHQVLIAIQMEESLRRADDTAFSSIVVGCSLTFSCTPKDVKVHADDNGTIVLITNPTSFIGII